MIAPAPEFAPRCRCGVCFCERCHPSKSRSDKLNHGVKKVGMLLRFMERWCAAQGWTLDGCLILHDGNLEASYR